jgi:hypothetical protein
MSEYIDSFIKSHREYFKRNHKVIESNYWNDNTRHEKGLKSFATQVASIETSDPKQKGKELEKLEKEIRSFVESSKKTKEALFKQENELTTSILGRLSVFISESEGDRGLEKRQSFIDETVEIIDLHLKKCDDYLKYNMDVLTQEVDTEDEVEYKSYEIVFQDLVFNEKIKIQEKLAKLNINNELDGANIEFFNKKKASLLMREPLCLVREDVKEIVDRIPVDWSLRTSKEMFINMNPRDIPKWNPNKHFFDQDPVAIQFWSEELNKIKHGVNINGYFMHPWLYFHLNFFRTPIPQIDGSEPNIQPDLRDNEWFFAENLVSCINKDNANFYSKALLMYGTRRFGKSVILASLAHWRTITKFNSFGSVIGGSSSDINALTSKIKTSMTYIDKPLQIDILKQEWDNGETTFGIKEDASNPIIFSTLIVQNLESGAKSKTQKTAGLAPSVSIYDEIGKYAFLKPYLAALPSFKTPYGFKCITVLAGTGGEADLSKDAIDVLSNPEAYDLLPMDWDLLENKIDPEFITWKRRKFATFFPGQMAYEEGFIKKQQAFSRFLDLEDADELDKIMIHTTNWENNSKLLKGVVEEAKKIGGSKGQLLEQQKRVQFPLDPEDCFMSSEDNPFPALEAKRHKDFLIESGDTGKRVTLMQDGTGKIFYELNNKELAEYPHQGGFVDAPIVLYEELPGEKPVDYLYVGGFDDYKQEESGTDSVGSFHIYKVNIGMDKWCGRIVASIASRPDPHNKLYRQIFLLMQAFNAKVFMENADMGFKEYLDRKRATDLWLVESMDFKSDMTQRSQGKRRYGWAPTPENIRFLFGLLKNYARQEFVIKDEEGNEKTILGVQMINDIGLLDEMISFKKDNNVDRMTSFMSCLGYEFYLFNNYMLPSTVNRRPKQEDSQKKKPEKTMAERLYGASTRTKKYF